MHKKPTHWFVFSIFLSAAITLFVRLRSNALLSFYDDDAFYYFQIARNMASRHGSTFDGTHLTNGYHPLWMLTLVALNLLAPGKTLFFLLQCIAFASVVTTFLAANSLFRYFSTNLAITQIAAAIIALQVLQLVLGGMEVTLTLPLALCLCWYRLRPQFRWTASEAMRYGLLAALVVLSRLDSLLLIVLLFLLDFSLLHLRPEDRLPRLYAVLSFALPVLLYALSNHVWFHVWLPISGQAKQMRFHSSLHLAAIRSAFDPINFPYWVIVVYPALLVLSGCVIGLCRAGRLQIRRITLAFCISLVAFPILQFLVFVTLSDWPIWPWYLYSLPLAMTGLFLLLFEQYPSAQLFRRAGDYVMLQAPIALLAFLFAWAHTADRSGERVQWYLYAKDIEAFSQNHDGIYAMGDCAGTTGYLIHQPLVQLEGLTMDADFLQNLRAQRNLNQVLQLYDVRYYVTLNPEHVGECYRTREPTQAGPDSPHMLGSFCQQPIATYQHSNVTVDIFDLKRDAASSTAPSR